jgi:tripartite-type tricarboxylate transporter receptor subunit TctC
MKPLQIAFAFAVALGTVSIAFAQTYPSRPVTIVVPFPPGGPSDALARILSERMSKSIGQPVVVENVAGQEAASASLALRVRYPTAMCSVLAIGTPTSRLKLSTRFSTTC